MESAEQPAADYPSVPVQHRNDSNRPEDIPPEDTTEPSQDHWWNNVWNYWRDAIAYVLILVFILAGLAFYLFKGPATGTFSYKPLRVPKPTNVSNHCAATLRRDHMTLADPARVGIPAGSASTISIYIARSGERQNGKSGPLTVQNGSLCPGSVLAVTTTEFARPDGLTLQANQLATWARVDPDGNHVTIWVAAAPHRDQTAEPGVYTGKAVLIDPRVEAAGLPVRVYVEYQNRNLAIAFSLLAAFFGFLWATLIHNIGREQRTGSPAAPFFRNLMLCAGVVLAAAIPVVNLQVLTKLGWEGGLSQYIALATVAGAAAIALTPTLRVSILHDWTPGQKRRTRARTAQAHGAQPLGGQADGAA